MCDCCTPTPTWNCTLNGCVDPGDGTGTYGSMADCEAMCSCDTYDNWPILYPNPGPNDPNQGSWCEWCLDYQNPNSFYYPNFNPNGINWGDPDVMCDCCNNNSIEDSLQKKSIVKTIDILGRDGNNKLFSIRLYDDGTVEKVYIIK